LGAVETPAVIDSLEKPSQAPAQFKITQAVSIKAAEQAAEVNGEQAGISLQTAIGSDQFVT
jgi:hypothetical protein